MCKRVPARASKPEIFMYVSCLWSEHHLRPTVYDTKRAKRTSRTPTVSHGPQSFPPHLHLPADSWCRRRVRLLKRQRLESCRIASDEHRTNERESGVGSNVTRRPNEPIPFLCLPSVNRCRIREPKESISAHFGLMMAGVLLA